MKPFTAAAVQMNALSDDLEHNLEVHGRFIAETAEAGCDLVLFPEISTTSHYGDSSVVKWAEEAGSGPVYSFIAEKAKKHDVIVAYGFCEVARGAHYNTHALVGPDGLIGTQSKCVASGDEYFAFRMGRSFHVFDIGLCRVGILICYDCAFSEHWRILALQGAEVILQASAGRAGGIRREVPPSEQLERLKGKLAAMPGSNGTYAAENGVFVVQCNQIGFNGHSTHNGGASLIDPSGRLLARSEASLDDLWVSAALDPELLKEARRQTNYTLKNRRPELYGAMSEMI